MSHDERLSDAKPGRGLRDKAKFRQDWTYLVGFPNVDNDEVLIRRVEYYKWNNERKIPGFIVPANEDLKRKADLVMGQIQTRWVTPIIIYRSDNQGNVIMDPFDYEILPFVMDKKKLSALKSINVTYPLGSVDIKITCQGEQYQDLIFLPMKNCIWRMINDRKPELGKKILEDVKVCAETMHEAVSFMMVDEQIKKLLEGNQQSGMRPSSEDLSGFRFGDSQAPAAPRPAAGGGSNLNVADLLKG